jgi:hypothetical protein
VILNRHTPEVGITYVTVFVCGCAVFVALSGLTATTRSLDLAFVGLAIGSLVPMVIGLTTFVRDWGVPDVLTTVSAYRDVLRMASYESATFGNRGNTAAFLVILAPVLVSLLLDGRKRLALRALCAVTLLPLILNLIILQVRAAFVSLLVMLVLIWTFRFGVRRLPLLLIAVLVGWVALIRAEPDLEWMVSNQFLPVLTMDVDADTSVEGRVSAIGEGWHIALQNWAVGIGPGGALSRHSRDSAHQFQVQQAMETGILGLIGSTLFSLSVCFSLSRTMALRRDETNDMRFVLLVGPASYVLYAILANATLGFGGLNIWTVLIASMLALAPPFEPRARGVLTVPSLGSHRPKLRARSSVTAPEAVRA